MRKNGHVLLATPMLRHCMSIIGLLSVVIVFFSSAYGQKIARYESPLYNVERVNLNHQASFGGTYYDIAMDTMGYTWIAGEKGLHVYDGVKTITYFGTDLRYRIIPRDWESKIYDIVKTKEGLFWLSFIKQHTHILFNPYSRTIEAYHYGRKNRINYDHLQINTQGELVYFDSDQNRNYDLICRDNQGKYKTILSLKQNGKPGRRVNALTVAGDNAFFYTATDFYVIDEQKDLILKEPKGTLRSITVFNDEVYGVFDDCEIKVFDSNKLGWKSLFKKKTTPQNTLEQFAINDSLLIWKGKRDLHIYNLNNGTSSDLTRQYTILEKKYNQKGRRTHSIKILPIETGYYILGMDALYRLDRLPANAEKYLEPLPTLDGRPSVRQLTRLDDGTIAVAYMGGLAQKAPGSVSFTSVNVSPKHHHLLGRAYCLHDWKNQYLWNGGVIQGDGSIDRDINNDDFSLSATTLVDSILYSYRWYSTDYKVQKMDLSTGKSSFHSLVNPQDSSFITPVIINKILKHPKEARLYIATNGRGIIITDLDLHNLKYYSPQMDDNLKGDILDLLIKDEMLYYASDKGVGSIDLNSDDISLHSITDVNNNNLLEPLKVWSLLERDERSIYVGSQKGLYRFDIDDQIFTGLQSSHPLSTMEFNRNSKFRDGQDIYMGTTTGLYRFSEDNLQWDTEDKTPPPIVIERIIVNRGSKNERIPTYDDMENVLHLDPDHHRLEVSFSTLNYGKHYFYTYRILEQDSTWGPFSLEGNVNILSLPAGKSTLQLMAATNKNTRYSTIKKVSFQKSMYWYQRWWAYVLYGAAVALLFYLIYRYRINQIRRYQRLRTKISSDLHDDVGSIMSGISLQSEVMSYTTDGEQREMLRALSSQSKDAMERMRDIVWALDARNDSVEDLLIKMKEYAEYNLSKKEITYQFSSDITTGQHALNPEKRQNIYYIYKEAITNIIKHSDATHVDIVMTKYSSSLTLSISDNGSPQASKTSAGQGLANMRMRAKRIGGTIAISKEQGYTVTLIV